MRRWIGRAFWLAAWSFWLWFGFGLYRELPRKAGPIVSRLPLGVFEGIRGFVGGLQQVAIEPTVNPTSRNVRILDVRTGKLIRKLERTLWLYDDDHLLRGVVFSVGREFKKRPLRFVDLTKERQRVLSERVEGGFNIHPKWPWVVFCESSDANRRSSKVTVVDWTTGAKWFVRPSQTDDGEIGAPYFLGDANRLLIPVRRSPERQAQSDTDVEVWRIGATNRLEKNVTIPDLETSRLKTSSSGRLAWPIDDPNEGDVRVFDLDSERIIYSTPLRDRSEATEERKFFHGVHLSKDGRAVMAGVPARLWEIDSARLLWEPQDGDSLDGCSDGTFAVIEDWRLRLGLFLESQDWNTVAVRDLASGALKFRCWQKDSDLLHCLNGDRTLGVTSGGVVHELPYRVNWPLLALCQTILALPLVLLWAVLRWRRKRRMLVAGVAT